MDFDLSGLKRDLRVYISNKLPGVADVVDPWTTLSAARLCRIQEVLRLESEMRRAHLVLHSPKYLFILSEYNPLP